MIAATDYQKVIGKKDTYNFKGISVTFENSQVMIPSDATDVIAFTLGGKDGYYTFWYSGGYLSATTTKSNYLRVQTAADNKSKASITIDENSNAKIVFNASGSIIRNRIKFYPNNSIFSCYSASSTDTKNVQLYVDESSFSQITISSTGYSTFFSDKAFVVPD